MMRQFWLVSTVGTGCALLLVGICRADGPPRSAAAPGGPAPFTEEALDRGIVFTTPHQGTTGHGAGFADLDNDGDPDLILTGDPTQQVAIYENDGAGFFTEVTNIDAETIQRAHGVAAADYDNDGDLDIYISCHNRPNLLLRNDGGFSFVDVAPALCVDDPAAAAFGVAWGDIDNDGWVDLYVPNRDSVADPPPNRLYRNLGGDGDGVCFEEIAAELGVDRGDDPTFQAQFFDYDRDGDADLYLANDKGYTCDSTGWRNRLFENIGGEFVDVTEATETGACIAAMCITTGDFDRNGFQDVYCTNTHEGNVLQLNPGPPDRTGTPWVFTDVAADAGVIVNEIGWGGVFFDYDHDTWLDLYVCNMHVDNMMFRNLGTIACADEAGILDVDTGGTSFTVATADVDRDGDLDMLIQNMNERIRLYINHEGNRRGWVKVRVVGEGVQHYAIGANIDVKTGEVEQLREVVAGCNYKNQNELVQHFGLSSAATVDALTVHWPRRAGAVTSRTLTNLQANRVWTVYPPDKLGDRNGDGDRDIDDLLGLVSAYTGAGLMLPPDQGLEVFDHDGDGDIDGEDLMMQVTLTTE